MWFRTLFEVLNRGRTRTPARRGAARIRPVACPLGVEALGDRIVPASLWASDATLIEGNAGTRYAEVRVTLDAPTNRTVTVNYGTADGYATTAANDYVATSGKLTFAPGETSKTVRVAVTGDRIGEPNESFTVNLQGAKNAKITGRQGIVTILDDEPRISISNGVEVAGPSGTRLWSFDVSLPAAYDQEVTVNYATADGTAIAGVDYLATSGTLSFAPARRPSPSRLNTSGRTRRTSTSTSAARAPTRGSILSPKPSGGIRPASRVRTAVWTGMAATRVLLRNCRKRIDVTSPAGGALTAGQAPTGPSMPQRPV